MFYLGDGFARRDGDGHGLDVSPTFNPVAPQKFCRRTLSISP
jgi:hypothetical protein